MALLVQYYLHIHTIRGHVKEFGDQVVFRNIHMTLSKGNREISEKEGTRRYFLNQVPDEGPSIARTVDEKGLAS